MNARHLIAEAWHFTRDNRRLMWVFAFLPAMLNTLVGIFYLLYQFFAFKRSPLFDNAEKSFLREVIETFFNFMGSHGGLWLPLIVAAIIIFILYSLLPTLCQGSLIQIIARRKKSEHIKISEGVSFGLLVFLPLLEYHLAVKTFSFFSFLTEAAFVLRNLGVGAMKTLLPVFIVGVVVAIILTLLFTYSEFFIVLDRKPVLRSMGRSAKLVVLSWQHTFLIATLMIIIGLRILFNLIAVLLVPTLLFLSIGFFATTTWTVVGIAVGAAVSFIALFTAAYFTGILNIFANTVWTYTYLELMGEKHTQEFMSE